MEGRSAAATVAPTERHKVRRLAVQVLCALDVQGADAWPAVQQYLSDQQEYPAVTEAARNLARHTFERRSFWDEQIAAVSERWDISRMGLVDRNILRMALCELTMPERTPVRVVLDEAIELAKEFGTEESPAFVNGVLDAVRKRMQGEEPASSASGSA